jgi:hypothetical protein
MQNPKIKILVPLDNLTTRRLTVQLRPVLLNEFVRVYGIFVRLVWLTAYKTYCISLQGLRPY